VIAADGSPELSAGCLKRWPAMWMHAGSHFEVSVWSVAPFPPLLLSRSWAGSLPRSVTGSTITLAGHAWCSRFRRCRDVSCLRPRSTRPSGRDAHDIQRADLVPAVLPSLPATCVSPCAFHRGVAFEEAPRRATGVVEHRSERRLRMVVACRTQVMGGGLRFMRSRHRRGLLRNRRSSIDGVF